MKEYSKVIYGKYLRVQKSEDCLLLNLYVDNNWIKSSNSLDNIRGEVFELLLNRLYEVSLGQVVLKSEIIECYYKTELFVACFKQKLES